MDVLTTEHMTLSYAVCQGSETGSVKWVRGFVGNPLGVWKRWEDNVQMALWVTVCEDDGLMMLGLDHVRI
jgi:hypothetical protein